MNAPDMIPSIFTGVLPKRNRYLLHKSLIDAVRLENKARIPIDWEAVVLDLLQLMSRERLAYTLNRADKYIDGLLASKLPNPKASEAIKLKHTHARLVGGKRHAELFRHWDVL